MDCIGKMMKEYRELFLKIPGVTSIAVHEIQTGNSNQLRFLQDAYRINMLVH